MDFLDIFLDKSASQPLYLQLYSRLANQIREGSLAAGERLPGKRTAAAQLGVSVNTVDEAYQMLAAEGYLHAKPRSGFWVAQLERAQRPPATQPPAPAAQGATSHAVRFSFATGGIDTSMFPLKMYNRILRDVLAKEDGLFARGEPRGDEVLRQALAVYLRGWRGVRCDAGQIIVGAGLEVLVGMLARLLAGGGPIAVENPGYAKVRRIFTNMGLAAAPVPVDSSGMQPGALALSGATAAYLTPSHQYPTGGVMPVGRRTELLLWAQAGGRVIIEDDYDSEFRFDGRPLPSMQGLDNEGCVVYAGTFSRSLAPGLRVAYLVLPPALLTRWNQAYGSFACTVSRPEQHTLARFMADGHFARSLARMRTSYRARRGRLIAAINAGLATTPHEVLQAHTGLYFLLRLPRRSAADIASTARGRGLDLMSLDEYLYPGAPAPPLAHLHETLVVGYGGLLDAEVEAAAEALAAAIK